MSNRLRALYLGLAAATAMITPAFAVDLTVICRCVVGGVNSETAVWIKESVIPGFTEEMKAEGKDVTVTLNEFGGKDEQMTQQLALDFSTGAGADVAAFDGFLIPSFVEGGLLKPLDEVAGADVNDWEGWSHISEGAKRPDELPGQGLWSRARHRRARHLRRAKTCSNSPGIDPATFQPKSWAELLDAARAIKKANPDSFPLQLNAGVNMGEATTMQGYYMALLGTGESVVDENGKYIVSSQGILDTLNLYKTIYVDEQLGDQRAQLLGDGRNQTFTNFRDGKTAMLVEGDWFYDSVTRAGRRVRHGRPRRRCQLGHDAGAGARQGLSAARTSSPSRAARASCSTRPPRTRPKPGRCSRFMNSQDAAHRVPGLSVRPAASATT